LGFAKLPPRGSERVGGEYWMLIAANVRLGRMDEARRYVVTLQALSPEVSLSRIRHGQQFRDPHRIEALIEGMRKAGCRRSRRYHLRMYDAIARCFMRCHLGRNHR
jgi:hypothetical protein